MSLLLFFANGLKFDRYQSISKKKFFLFCTNFLAIFLQDSIALSRVVKTNRFIYYNNVDRSTENLSGYVIEMKMLLSKCIPWNAPTWHVTRKCIIFQFVETHSMPNLRLIRVSFSGKSVWIVSFKNYSSVQLISTKICRILFLTKDFGLW